MPKYLIRGGRLPYQKVPVENYLDANMFGNNTGNYMYLNAILRTLMTDENTKFVCTNYKRNFSKKEIDQINAECDGFIIPLADAFRPDFVDEMKDLTNLVNKLEIPSYIIGAGIRAGSEEQFPARHYGFEDETTEFIKAVLKKSACVGVRGEFTADFLKYLGFKEEEDYRVIGCPSLYTYGNRLHIRETDITPDFKAACSGTLTTDMETIQKMGEYMKEFHDLIFVGQLRRELKTLYLGVDYKTDEDLTAYYPCTIHHPLYANDKVRFFYNTDKWVDFYRDMDFTFGTRFHGVVPSILGGAPSLLIIKDIRMRELAEFHHLPHVQTIDLNHYKSIWDVIESMDFHSPEAVAPKNFENYIDFLHLNGFKTIYDENPDRKDAPLDQRIAEADVTPEVTSCVRCSPEELTERFRNSYEFVVKRQEQLKTKANKSSAEVKKSNARVRQLEGEVNRQKGDVNRLKGEVNRLEGDVSRLSSEIKGKDALMNRRLVRTAIKIQHKLDR
ncbi:MAG: polysaccharide pyruvyl transferase family protein [Lachnospiraceae bacterium]|nr:polysaccharide pyruvyl transferase family protein [Lachnospiraceae bacterium]